MARSKVTPDRRSLVLERVVALSKRDRDKDKPTADAKSKGDDETAPLAIKRADTRGDDETAPVDPKLQARLAKDSFDDVTVIPPHPIPDEETPSEAAIGRARG